MDWILFVVIASTAMSDNKAVHTSAVPMANQQLCTAARGKLAEAYKKCKARTSRSSANVSRLVEM